MRVYFSFLWLILVFSDIWHSVSGHGKLVDPPGRNTVMNTQTGKDWKQCNTGQINYSDKSNFCGGKGTQEANGGKCSACGDNWNATYPRKHDSGGVYAKKITPVRAYLQGQNITVKVLITASHEGHFEFRLCPKLEGEGPEDDELTKCYEDPDQYRLLQMTDGKIWAEGISQTMEYSFDLQLPKDVNCVKGCNLQWWYKAGNSWGCDPDGSCGTGKGAQEHFVNCADILILTCEQYESGRFPDWCAYGPTKKLENCRTDEASDHGVTNTHSEPTKPDVEVEPGPGEATGAGAGAGTGSDLGMEPVRPVDVDQGAGTHPAHPFLRVCYYSNWSQYRNGQGKFFPENIDPYLCTHLIYSFAKLQNNKLATYEWNDKQLYQRFNQLKETNPDLKTLLAVGGWNFGSPPFSKLAASSSLRSQFATTSVEFLREHEFDGLDMDWEYPALRGGDPEDKANFVLLLKDLKEAFEAEHARSGQPRLLLTAAVAAGRKNIEPAYDIPGMNEYLDFINLMSYDLHGAWEKFTGHNAPLKENDVNAELNVDWAARYWRDNGTPANKLIIGLATFGRTFTLTNPSANAMGAPARGAGSAGLYTGEAGFTAYYEVCLKLSRNEGIKKWDAERQVPYLVAGNQWIGYDDEDSFAAKLRYIRDNNYGGAMVWNIDLDDFKKICPLSTRNYPLMSLMSEILDSPAGEPTDKKLSRSPSSETVETPSGGTTNTDYTEPGKTDANGDGNGDWTPSNDDNTNNNGETGDSGGNTKTDNNNNNNNNNNYNYDNNNKESDGNIDNSNNEKENNEEWVPEKPKNVPDVGGSIICETCYRTGLPYCDACCETIVTSEFQGTNPVFNSWCQANCRRGFCPASHCKTSEVKHFQQSCEIPNISGSLSTTPSCDDCQRQGSESCDNKCCEKRVTKTFKGKSAVFDTWCANNCARGFCPNSFCLTEEANVWTDICVVALRDLHDILSDFRKDNDKMRHL